jgi:uncharacterized protein YdhG (YjbR/CyaY superfamily)
MPLERTSGAHRILFGAEGEVYKMAHRSTAASVDEYIAEFPPATQEKLEQLRGIIRTAAPDASEMISYAIPTFDLDGRHLVHFAGYASHIGLYPIGPGLTEALGKELETYKREKSSARFPLDQPLPAELIRRIVEFRIRESRAKAGK